MIKVLLAIHNQNSIDLIKAVCCCKSCKVFIADNSDKVLYFLREETIDIVFLDLSSLYSSAFDLIFSANEFERELPVVMISEQISLSEERELRKNKIFYHAVMPFNPDEIEQVIESAIKAVTTEMPDKECYTEGKTVTRNFINKEQIEKWKQKTSKKVFGSVFRSIPNFDKRIISAIRGLEFKYLENYLSFVAKPAKKIDTLMMNLTQRIL